MIKKLSEIRGHSCICRGAADQIGEYISKEGKTLYKFNVDCPIHGIFDVTDEPPLTDEDDADKENV